MDVVSNHCTKELGTRRAYNEEDAFFEEGNVLRYSKFVASSFSSSSSDLNVAIETISAPLLLHGKNRIRCNFPGCYEKFDSIPSFNAHYSVHSYHCLTCNAILPNERLLDIHIFENHSSYFEAQASRKPSYVCIVESCGKMFWTAEERSKHLTNVHRFSSKFSFVARTCTKTQSTKTDKMKYGRDPRRIVCKFVKLGQECKKGTKCKFLHPKTQNVGMECASVGERVGTIFTADTDKATNDNDTSSASLESSVSALMDKFEQISFGQRNACARTRGGVTRKQRLQL